MTVQPTLVNNPSGEFGAQRILPNIIQSVPGHSSLDTSLMSHASVPALTGSTPSVVDATSFALERNDSSQVVSMVCSSSCSFAELWSMKDPFEFLSAMRESFVFFAVSEGNARIRKSIEMRSEKDWPCDHRCKGEESSGQELAESLL